MPNCHTCHWADRDHKSGEQIIHKEPDYLNPENKPGGAIPDVRVVRSCGRGANYFKTYGQRDHDCKKYKDASIAQAEQEAHEAEKRKEWKHPTSRAKLTNTDNMLQLIEDMAEGNNDTFDILFDVMASYPNKLHSLIKNLDDMNIRGAQIPIALGAADSSLQVLMEMAQARDPSLVYAVNTRFAKADKEKAVLRDASKYGHGPAKKIKPAAPRVVKLSKLRKLRRKPKTEWSRKSV